MVIIPPAKRKSRGRPVASPLTPPAPPPPPPGLPHVVSTNFSGNTVTMTFDQPVTVTGSTPDDAITVNGMTAGSAVNADEFTISLAMPDFVNGGDPWVISRQPEWVETEIVVPEDGVL